VPQNLAIALAARGVAYTSKGKTPRGKTRGAEWGGVVRGAHDISSMP
jgi:hypothetical protein